VCRITSRETHQQAEKRSDQRRGKVSASLKERLPPSQEEDEEASRAMHQSTTPLCRKPR